MNKEQCQNAIQHIRPSDDFAQRTFDYLRQKQAEARKRTVRLRIAAAALAATACAVFAIFVLPGLLRETPEAPSGVAVSTPTQAAERTATAPPAQTQRIVLDGSPVHYSSLKFNYTEDLQYPDVPDQTQAMCILAFSEHMLTQSQLVAIATVEAVQFKQYFRYTHTAVYTLRLDKIFYSELDVGEGDTFIVEQMLYGGTLSDSEFGLKPGGRYILPIYADPGVVQEYDVDENLSTAAKESPYTFVYPFQPMIELTEGGGYLFFGDRDENGGGFGWKSLVNEETAEVIMDVETASGAESWIDHMKLRADDQFEDDFQALVDYYCVEGGAEYQGAIDTIPQGSAITGEEAMLIGEAAVPEGLDIATESCWFDVIRKEWNVHFEFDNTESVYDIRLTPDGDIIDAVWR